MSEIQGLGAPETSPEKAIPIPTPSAPASPPVPSVETLQSWAPLYLKKADRTISHLNRILSTPSGTDVLLMTIGYSSLLTSSVLSNISIRQIQSRLAVLLSAASTLPKDTTILITPSGLPPPRLYQISQSFKSLSGLISDFRIFVRLWGLLSIWKWGKSLIVSPPEDLVKRRIAWAQVAVNVGFQYLENGAYLSGKGILGWSAEKQGKAWRWSSRFWAAHVGLDFLRLAYEMQLVKSKKGKEKDEEEKKVNAKWRRQLVVNSAYAPLTIHWSLAHGLISESWVGILGTVVGVLGLTELWKNTAED